VIRGTLVAARTTTPIVGEGATSLSGAAAAKRGTDPSSDPFGWIAGVLAAGALVWLGGRRELRGRPEPAR